MFCYQIVIEVWFKRCLLRVQKGVSKGLKGHLLQAKRALIRMELTPSYFSRFEFPLQYRGTKEDRRIKNKDYVFYCHKQLVHSSTCSLIHSFSCYYVFLTSNLLTCVLVNYPYHKVQCSKLIVQRKKHPSANCFQHSPSLSERGLGGEVPSPPDRVYLR